jgi:predicted ATPase
MLQSLQLKNYRCFDRHEVTFHNLNVVVGANNAGKSTLIEAIRLLGLVVRKYRHGNYVRPPEWTELPGSLLGICPKMHDIDLRGGSVFHRYGNPPAVIVAKFSNNTRVEVYVGPHNEIFGLVYESTGELLRSRSRAMHVPIPAIAILPQIGPLLESELLLTENYVLGCIDTALASKHFRNEIYWLRSQVFEDFKNQAEESWHQLHIESLNVEGDPPEQFLSFHVRDMNFVAEIGWMGHGLQMWLQTMWFLARSSHAGTVILDEPDVYMHADLQRRLIRLLRNRDGQKVIATHSVEIMSEVDPGDILIVDKARRRSSFAASLPAVQNTIDQMGGVHNIHLARLWGSRQCLHVEGKDIAILKTFQDALYPTSHSSFDVIPCLSIGGWSGWNYAIGSSMSLKNAAGETIITYCILDSDYHTPEEILERYKQAAEHKIQLHVWKMKEIENYLLVPVAIARIIVNAFPARLAGPSAQEVQGKIDEIAEQMKNSIFDALAHEYICRDKPGGVPTANPRARERLEEAWNTRDGRWSIIPGKHVISRLSEWAKASFGVSFGPARIARELRPDELPAEIKSVVRAIERAQPFPVGFSQRR